METRQVLQIWEQVVGRPLDQKWVQQFLAHPQIAELSQLSERDVRESAEEVFSLNGELRVAKWLKEARRKLAGESPADQLRSTYGYGGSDAVLQRPTDGSRGGRSRRGDRVWAAPSDSELHNWISDITKERPDY